VRTSKVRLNAARASALAAAAHAPSTSKEGSEAIRGTRLGGVFLILSQKGRLKGAKKVLDERTTSMFECEEARIAME